MSGRHKKSKEWLEKRLVKGIKVFLNRRNIKSVNMLVNNKKIFLKKRKKGLIWPPMISKSFGR